MTLKMRICFSYFEKKTFELEFKAGGKQKHHQSRIKLHKRRRWCKWKAPIKLFVKPPIWKVIFLHVIHPLVEELLIFRVISCLQSSCSGFFIRNKRSQAPMVFLVSCLEGTILHPFNFFSPFWCKKLRLSSSSAVMI